MSKPQSDRTYFVVNVGHEKLLDTHGHGVSVWRYKDADIASTISRSKSGNVRWKVMECPHEPDAVYLVNCGHDKFLNTEGDGVSVWRYKDADIASMISRNKSGKIRWKVIDCPHQPETHYIINSAHERFLDTQGDQVFVWRADGCDIETTIASNTSRHAGNIRWKFIEVTGESEEESTALLPRAFLACGSVRDGPSMIMMQFNVLADGLGQGQFKGRVPSDALSFEHRLPLALLEVQRVSPDVLCMQEVNHFDSWKDQLGRLGYDGIFIPKYDDSYPAAFREPPGYYRGQPTDGCALFLRRDHYKLRASIAKRFADLTGHADMSQVLLAAAIEESATGQHVFTVSLSHLKAGGGHHNGEMRKVQGLAWVDALRAFSAEVGEAPLVLCGDMNEDMSHAPEGGVASLCRGLDLKSAYALGHGRDPVYTVIDGSWRSCLDYILVSNGVFPKALWEVPHLPDDALPSSNYPSDHLAIAAELHFGD